jgi:hypothetical protein
MAMGVMRNSDLIWDELVDAFANTDTDLIFFFDRETSEVFFVPSDYEDESFWEEVERAHERYLPIPLFDYEQERLLLYDFIAGLRDENLRSFLAGAYAGQSPFGRIDEILSFYPDEYERLAQLKEQALAEIIQGWLGEYDLIAPSTY